MIFKVSLRPVIAATVTLLLAAQPLCACAAALASATAEPAAGVDCHGETPGAAAEASLHCSDVDCAECSAAADEPAPLVTKTVDSPEPPALPANRWPPVPAAVPPARDGPPDLPARSTVTPVTLFQVLRD